jgi:hypothetical protein
VTLEGLRRLDEGIKPKAPFAEEGVSYTEDPDGVKEGVEAVEYDSDSGMPLSLMVDNASGGGRSKLVYAAVAAAVLVLVAVAGIPAGWYGKGKAAATPATAQAASPAPEAQAPSVDAETAAQPEQPAVDPASAETAAANGEAANALALKRAREAKDRARFAEAAAAKQAAAANQPNPAEAAKKVEPAKPAPKMVTVQVSYDEAGRVTQTSGGDGTAQRIARQKRFPAGKAGSTTVTIPIN